MIDELNQRTVVRLIATVVLASRLMTASAHAQLPQMRLYSITPAGAQAGTITEVTIAEGADLDEVDGLHFSHPGIFATPLMKESAAGLQPVQNKFRVAVSKDVPPGRYEVCAGGLYGVSNPRTFIVGHRQEVQEAEPNQSFDQAQPLAIGSVVNGLIKEAGDIDLFRFSAQTGQRIVLDCQARHIDSRLSPFLTLKDATDRPLQFSGSMYGEDDLLVFDVPADAEYFVELRDLAYAGGADHGYRLAIHTDPYLRFAIPAAGQFGTTGQVTLFGYNLPGSERTESISAGVPLEKLLVNIPVPAQVEIERHVGGLPSPAAGLDLFAYRLETEQGPSNTVYLGATDDPVMTEQEPNNEPATSQPITAPADITGQFFTPGDVDIYTIEARQGEELQIEVLGHRLGVPVDPLLTVDQVTIDEQGNEQTKRLTIQDDDATNLAANIFDTATDDPVFRLQAPVDGTYRLTVRDRAYEHNGDPSLVYRLIVRPPRPDFRLVAVPSGSVAGQTWPVSLRRGDHFAVDVLAFRRDGFDGPIDITAVELPYGLEMMPAAIAAKQTTATLILTAAEDAPSAQGLLLLEGTATLDTPQGPQTLKHPVRAGSIVWSRNGNVPAVSRLSDSLAVSVMQEAAPYSVSHQSSRPLEVHQGRQILIPLTLSTPEQAEPKMGLGSDLVLKPGGLPKDAKIEVTDITIPKGQTVNTLRLFVQPDCPPGTYLVHLTGQVQVPYRRNPARAARLKTLKDRAVEKEKQQQALAKQTDARAAALAAQLQQATSQVQQTQTDITALEQELAEVNRLADQTSSAVGAVTDQAAVSDELSNEAAVDAPDEHLQDKLSAAKEQFAKQQASEQSLQAEKQRADRMLLLQTQATKQAEESRQAAEKAASEAETAAKPSNINVTQPVPPIVIVVKPAPVKLEARLFSAEVKPGASVEVTVTIARQNEFAGPVDLSLFLPDHAQESVAAEFTVPPDQTTAVLKYTVAKGTAPGTIPYFVVRAKADHGGEAIIEAPLTVKIIE